MRAERDVEGGRVLAARRPGGVEVDGVAGIQVNGTAGAGPGAASGAGCGYVQRGGGSLPEWRGVAAGAVTDGGVYNSMRDEREESPVLEKEFLYFRSFDTSLALRNVFLLCAWGLLMHLSHGISLLGAVLSSASISRLSVFGSLFLAVPC